MMDWHGTSSATNHTRYLQYPSNLVMMIGCHWLLPIYHPQLNTNAHIARVFCFRSTLRHMSATSCLTPTLT